MARLGRAYPASLYRPETSFPPKGSAQTADGVDTTVTASLSSDATVTRNADATTTVTAGLTAAASRTANGAATTIVTVGLTAAATITRNAAATTAVTVGLTAAADRTTFGAGSTPVTAGLTAAAGRTTYADGTTTVTVGLTATAAQSMSGAANTAVTVGLTAAATTEAPPIDSSLTVAVGLTASASVSSGMAATTAVTAGLTAAASKTLPATATTTVTVGVTAAAALATSTTTSTTITATLTASATISSTANASLVVGVVLDATVTKTVDANMGALLRRGISPSTIVRGSDGAYAIAVYFGNILVWDGTRPVMVQIPVANGTGTARPGIAATGAIGVAATAGGSGVAFQSIPVVPGLVVAPAATGSGTVPTPVPNVVAEVATPPAEGTGVAPTPGVLVTTDAIAIHVTATGSGTAPAATPVVTALVVAPPATGSGLAPAPVGGVASITVAPVATGSGLALAPTPKGAVLFVAPPAIGTGSAIPPTPTVPTSKTAVVATGSGLAPNPTVPTFINIIDNFNRSNGGMGSGWTALLNGGPVIVSNRIRGGTSGPSSATSSYIAANNTPYATDTQEVSQWIVSPTGGVYDFTVGSMAWLRGTTDGQSRVGVLATQTGTDGSVHNISIVSYTAGVPTVRATTTAYQFDQSGTVGPLPAPNKIGLRAVGNVYTIIVAEIPTTVTWTDTGNVISQSNRTWGVECRTVENGAGTPAYAQGIAQAEARDYLGVDWVDTNVYQRPTWGTIITNFTYYNASTVKFHNGLDIQGASGRNIYAIANGVVDITDTGHTYADGSTFGNAISILHEPGYLSIYGHLATVTVTAGQTVTRGQIIGTMGNTGNSGGSNHLHFSLVRGRSVNDINDPFLMDLPAPPGQLPYSDPARFLASRGVALSWGTAL